MVKKRIKITLANKTIKEMDLSNLREIPEDMFSGRKDIFKIELPEGVEVVGSNAFESCTSLEEIIFPATIKEIGYEAFINCINWKNAILPERAKVDITSFSGCTSLGQ